MEPREGRVVDGQIVLNEETDLVEGSRVVVLVELQEQSVSVTNDELALIHQGQRDARDGKLVDARAFLQALRES